MSALFCKPKPDVLARSQSHEQDADLALRMQTTFALMPRGRRLLALTIAGRLTDGFYEDFHGEPFSAAVLSDTELAECDAYAWWTRQRNKKALATRAHREIHRRKQGDKAHG